MKPKDIIVGQRYTNSFFSPHDVWLGCGRRKLYTDDVFTSKFLVLVESDAPENIGKIFQSPRNAHNGFWEAFQKEDAESSMWITTIL